MPTLVVKYKDGSRSYPLREGVPVFIGRAKECDIHLPTPAVSRRHAFIIYKNGICGVKDLGSFNGTLLNDVEITQPCHLTDNDVLRISSFVIKLHSRESVTGPSQPAVPAPASDDEGDADATAASFSERGLPDSDLRLPRAMVGDDPFNQTAEDAHSGEPRPDSTDGNTKRYAPDTDTVEYLPGSQEAAPAHAETATIAGESPLDSRSAESTIELARPADYAVKLAANAQAALEAMLPYPTAPGGQEVPRKELTSTDTDYFRSFEPEREASVTTDTTQETFDAAPDPDLQSGASAENVDAETVIPLQENPESAPLLTLDWDDEATNLALEQLVADLPPRNATFRGIPGSAAGSTDTDALSPEPEQPADAEASTSTEPDAATQPDTDASIDLDADTVASASETAEYDQIAEYAALSDAEPAGATSRASSSERLSRIRHSAGLPGIDTIPISPSLLTAINARLSLHSLLSDLSEERQLYRMGNPDLSPEVAEELARQDSERDNLPTADEAERRIQNTRTTRDAFDDAVEEANRLSMPLPEQLPLPRGVEEMAISQWTLIRDSNREMLPPVLKEAYRLAADEELARELAAARINHGRLLGGAVYLLALEILANSTPSARKSDSTRMQRPSEEVTDKKRKGLLGMLGQTVNRLKNRDAIREEAEKLAEQNRVNQQQAGLAAREFAFMEKNLIREFQQVYAQTAMYFVPRNEDMPIAVRAFLRFGAVGFKSWWMSDAVREFIIGNCTENILPSFEVGPEVTNVLYADEYLAAVAHMECTPFPDENLAELGRNSIEWKTERAYRRIVNSRTYNIMMEDMLQNLDQRLQDFDADLAGLEERMAESKAKPFATNKEDMFELETEQQAVAIRKANLEKHIKRIEKEVVASILESVEEAEGRFRKGELHMPDPVSRVRREARALAELARRMGGLKPRFMPLMLREHFSFDPGIGVVNDRDTVREKLQDIEKLDPSLFVSVIIPAKRKENRIELRLSPTIVILPAAGIRGVCSMGREGMESGHLSLPICFSREHIRNRQLANLLADFRWETSRNMAGRDVMNSDTLAGIFMKIRWEWRNEPKSKRERGLILNELSDAKNWRRMYELYLTDATTGARQMFLRNPECYNAIINRFIDLPAGVKMLRK